MYITSNKVKGFIKDYDETKYLSLFVCEKFNVVFNRTGYLIRLINSISHVLYRDYSKIEVDSDDDLHLEITLNLHIVVTLIKLVFLKTQAQYQYNVFLERCLYQLAKN